MSAYASRLNAMVALDISAFHVCTMSLSHRAPKAATATDALLRQDNASCATGNVFTKKLLECLSTLSDTAVLARIKLG